MTIEITNEQHVLIYGRPKSRTSSAESLTASDIQDLIVSNMIDKAAPLTKSILSSLGAIVDNRPKITAFWESKNYISDIPVIETHNYSIAAVDGACLTESLYTHDLLASTVVAADGLAGKQFVNMVPPMTWAQLTSRTLENSQIARLHMLADELNVLVQCSHTLRLIDGSHINTFIALVKGLSTAEKKNTKFPLKTIEDLNSEAPLTLQREALKMLNNMDIEKVISELISNNTSRMIASLAKADTGVLLRNELVNAGILPPDAPLLNDKALVALVLKNGQMIKPRSMNASGEDKGPLLNIQIPGNLKGTEMESIVEKFNKEIEPLREVIKKGHMQVAFAKPVGSPTALRIQMILSPDEDEALQSMSLATARVAAEVCGPNIQEPYPQFIADLYAKNISIASEALKHAVIAGLPDSAKEYAPLLLMGYRT